jgi:hypothetical protein
MLTLYKYESSWSVWSSAEDAARGGGGMAIADWGGICGSRSCQGSMARAWQQASVSDCLILALGIHTTVGVGFVIS